MDVEIGRYLSFDRPPSPVVDVCRLFGLIFKGLIVQIDGFAQRGRLSSRGEQGRHWSALVNASQRWSILVDGSCC